MSCCDPSGLNVVLSLLDPLEPLMISHGIVTFLWLGGSRMHTHAVLSANDAEAVSLQLEKLRKYVWNGFLSVYANHRMRIFCRDSVL